MSLPADVVLVVFTWLLLGAVTLWFVTQMRTLSGRVEPVNHNMSMLIVLGGLLSMIIAIATMVARAFAAEAAFALDSRLPKN